MVEVKSIGNPAGIGQGTGLGLRDRDRDGIGLRHYRLRTTKAYKIYCDIIDTKFVIARLDHPLIARAVQILNAIALGLYISVNSPTTT